jgi:hypothetical protein
MKNQKTNPSTISTYKTIKKIRGNWGNLNPVTRRIENKKHEYQFPDSYYDDGKDYEHESHYNREEEIENSINLDDWSDW